MNTKPAQEESVAPIASGALVLLALAVALTDPFAFVADGLAHTERTLTISGQAPRAYEHESAAATRNLEYRSGNYEALYLDADGGSEPAPYTPDLWLAVGFDDAGFAHDDSGWRAFRHRSPRGVRSEGPSEVFVRLPERFATCDCGHGYSPPVYEANLAILEAALRASDDRMEVGPIDETEIGVDLDGDGVLAREATLRGVPPRYLGDASTIPVVPGQLPEGAELLQVIRPGPNSVDVHGLRYSLRRGRVAGVESNWQWVSYEKTPSGELRHVPAHELARCKTCHGGGVAKDELLALPNKVHGVVGWGRREASNAVGY